MQGIQILILLCLWEILRQAKQQLNLIKGPSCHVSSFRQQEMDVPHFAVHNICRGSHSTPQRGCAIVLKLSIVLAVASLAFLGDLPGAWEPTVLKFGVEQLSLSSVIVQLHANTDWVGCPAYQFHRNLAQWQWRGKRLVSQSVGVRHRI